MKRMSSEKSLFLVSGYWLLMLCASLALNYTALPGGVVLGLEVVFLFLFVFLSTRPCQDRKETEEAALKKATEKCVSISTVIIFLGAMFFTSSDELQLDGQKVAVLLFGIGTGIVLLRAILFHVYNKNV